MKNNWKEEFDNYFLEKIGKDDGYIEERRIAKDFITSLLAEQKKELLDLVEKEVEKMLIPPLEWKECVKAYHNREDYCAVCGFNPDTLSSEISTIINNLRV